MRLERALDRNLGQRAQTLSAVSNVPSVADLSGRFWLLASSSDRVGTDTPLDRLRAGSVRPGPVRKSGAFCLIVWRAGAPSPANVFRGLPCGEQL
jgi:hypothetical protein